MFLLSSKSKLKNRGFTLLEMVVVLTIFLITTVIVLSNFKGFSRKSSLDLLAQEMSLVIRQAQVYGIATKFQDTGGVKDFPSYGIYINVVNPTHFILFADQNDSGKYEASDVQLEQFNLYGGARIKDLLDENDNPLPRINGGINVAMVFRRPAVETLFNCLPVCPSPSQIKIQIEDAGLNNPNNTRNIVVWKTGHIYVESQLNP